MKQKEKYICFSLSGLFKVFLIVVVLIAAAAVMYLPRTDLFKGSLVQVPPEITTEEVEAGTIVIEYLKDSNERIVSAGSSNVSVSKLAFKIGNESVEIGGITFELEGTMHSQSFENFAIYKDDQKIENIEYRWEGDQSLFVDLFESPLLFDEYGEIEIFADIPNTNTGDTASFHFVELIAEGTNSESEITSIGVNGTLDPVPLLIAIN